MDEAFIEDEFNLTGLNTVVPYYHEALDAILDMELEGYSEQELRLISESAEVLYLLIHQRYICSRQGIHRLVRFFRHQELHGLIPLIHTLLVRSVRQWRL